jgi:hypothetical protein
MYWRPSRTGVMDTGLPRNSVMRMNIRLITAALVALSVVPAAALAASDQGSLAPRPALVSAHGLTVRSTVGSFCVNGRSRRGASVGMCADSAYPLPTRGRLPVSGGDRVALRFRHNPRIQDRIGSVVVTPVHASRHSAPDDPLLHPVSAMQNGAHPSHWHVRLPAGLGNANTLDISVRYSHHHGDADFWAGIRASR